MLDFDDNEIAIIRKWLSEGLSDEGDRTTIQGILDQIADVEEERKWTNGLFAPIPNISVKIQGLMDADDTTRN